MKSGKYRVSFEVELQECQSEECARDAIGEMCLELLEQGEFWELGLELLEEFDLDYMVEEDEVEELSFEEAN